MSDQIAEGDRPASHDAEVLWKLYAHAVDEYRFQVNLNWQRLQYFLGLNLADPRCGGRSSSPRV